MTHPVVHDDLMRYLDGELPPEERARVEEHLAACTECRREVTVFGSLKEELRGMSFRLKEGGRASVWDRVNRRVTRPAGWILLLVGVAVWAAYGVYAFVRSPEALWEKLATGAVVVGILLLLASVIWERYREWLTDPYRDVQQ